MAAPIARAEDDGRERGLDLAQPTRAVLLHLVGAAALGAGDELRARGEELAGVALLLPVDRGLEARLRSRVRVRSEGEEGERESDAHHFFGQSLK